MKNGTENKSTLLLEDLNGHSTCRKLRDIEDSLKETGGIIAFKRVQAKPENARIDLQAAVQCVYSPEAESFILKITNENGWWARAQYSQGREELAAMDFIREVFEYEGRGD